MRRDRMAPARAAVRPRRLQLLLRLVPLALLTTSAGTAQISLRVNNVIQVGPSGSSVCQELRDVLSSITDGGTDNRYLVRLEPGRYTCGAQPLVVPEGVTLEGAGRGADGLGPTEISGDVDNEFIGVVHLLDPIGIRSLRVVNTLGIPVYGEIAVSVWSFDHVRAVLEDVSLQGAFTGPGNFSLLAIAAGVNVRNSVVGDNDFTNSYAHLAYSRVGTVTGPGSSWSCAYSYTGACTPLDSYCLP